MSDDYVIEDDGGTTAFVNPDVGECPVIPLGFVGRDIVFALPEGEIRREAAGRISTMLRTDVYASVEGTTFLGNWRGDDGKLQLQTAGQWLVRQCRSRGIWDADRPQRSLGVWPSADGPLVHAGDAVGHWPFGEGDWSPVTAMLKATGSGPIWLLRPPAPRPKEPATVKDAERLWSLLEMWRFAPIGDQLSGRDVLMGWAGVALLGAVPPFRPHISINGGKGAGKTTLSRLMQSVCSANAGDLLDAFTEAGIRNSLSGEARALFLDEAEPSLDGSPGPVEKVMELLRRMSTGEGSSGRKGDIGGRSVSTSAIGCAYLASIFPVPLGDAMQTRMVEARVLPLGTAKGGADETLRAGIEWAKATSPRFLARVVRDWDRYRADLALLKAAFGASGQDPRGADLVASLAAGRRLLMHDEPLTEATAASEVLRWLALVKGREAAATGQNPGLACLSKIWAINSGQHVRDRHLTLGEMVQEEMTSPGYHDKVLKTWGLKVENSHANHERPGPWLLISTNHPSLAKALAGSHFTNWRGVLEHLADEGPQWTPKPAGNVRFGMHQSKALAVPLTPWLEGPIAVGVDPQAATPFDEPDWDGRFGAASRPASQPGEPDA